MALFRKLGIGYRAGLVLGLMALIGVSAVACSSDGVAQEDYDAVSASLNSAQADLSSAQSEITVLKTDLAELSGSGVVTTSPHQVVKVDVSQAESTKTVLEDWQTAEAAHMGVFLLDSFDSSGPAAWDAAEHPTVFVTSEGEGYAGFISETYKGAGLQIIDAVTKEHVASAEYNLGYEQHGEPHGMGVSPDGQWIYVPTADGDAPWRAGGTGGRLLIVNAQTLKIDQILQTRGGPHHVKAFTDANGEHKIIVELQGNGVMLLDPHDDHKVVGAWSVEDFGAETYQADANPAGTHIYVNTHLGSRGIAPQLQAAVAKVDLETGRISYITGVGSYTNGFAFTSDGKFTYVVDSVTDHVFKIDNSTDKVIGKSMTAVPGPYMIELNDDETELWIIGKGEMTFNLGGSLGLVNTQSMRAVNAYDIGGQTIDHNIFNPADSTEMWVTSSGTAEIIVFDVVSRTVKARIPSANGGDTHSGAFVTYTAGFEGTLLADNTGRHASFLEQQKEAVNALAVAK